MTPEGERKLQISSVTSLSEGGRKCQVGQRKAVKQNGQCLKIDKTEWSQKKIQSAGGRERGGRKVQTEESVILFYIFSNLKSSYYRIEKM